MRGALCVTTGLLFSAVCFAQTGTTRPAGCPAEIDVNGDKPLTTVTLPPSKKCKTRKKNDFLLPDPNCTPGAINETLTLDVMTNKGFGTDCVRNQATSADKKLDTYTWYKARKPVTNTGKNQVCELDHLVSLELGGADTLDNIWPQCGPKKAILNSRYFKRKDAVENFLAGEVRNGKISLAEAQKRIAEDWTQFLDDAEACPKGDCSNP
jgi:hypothetical protein